MYMEFTNGVRSFHSAGEHVPHSFGASPGGGFGESRIRQHPPVIPSFYPHFYLYGVRFAMNMLQGKNV
jgi:hypothetical protein